jgi:hypothetical protein
LLAKHEQLEQKELAQQIREQHIASPVVQALNDQPDVPQLVQNAQDVLPK